MDGTGMVATQEAWRERARIVARAPVLLVACDFDGTLAPLALRPSLVKASPEAVEALTELARTPHTHAGVISGRSRAQLVGYFEGIRGLHLVGSHGVEFEAGVRLTPQQGAVLESLNEELARIASQHEGAFVEAKPAGVAIHYREVGLERVGLVREAALASARPGVRMLEGHMVIEFSVLEGDKGAALTTLKYRTGATACVFIGDDTTDEDAFGVLGPHDFGVKVGEGPTRATASIPSTDQVAPLLRELVEARRDMLRERVLVPLERLAMVSDQRTVALLTPDAKVCWMCSPRIDSPPIFASLLGGPGAGSFEVAPADGSPPVSQKYIEDSMVLRTEYPGFTVTDYMDCSGGRAFQRAGRSDLVRVVEGTGKVAIRFAPRVDFGRQSTRLVVHPEGLEVDGAPDPIVLYAPGLRWSLSEAGTHQTGVAEVELEGDTPLILELRCGTGSLREPFTPEIERRTQASRFWSAWAATLKLPKTAPELVKRSALVIKGLCYGPTGAICAAGTTSLPEHLGGVRNWDYRYCWPRDASLAAASLIRLGTTGHAIKLLDWIMNILDRLDTPERLRPIYTVAGNHLGSEAEIGEVGGYGESRPVRVGNAAATQVQLDVFGPIADLVWMLAANGAPVSPEHLRLVRAMANAAEMRWKEPDHGIWEIRLARRQHVHTKVMCWMTLDRALRVEEMTLGRRRREWDELMVEIRNEVETQGWCEEQHAYTIAYGSKELDAASLWTGLSGMVPHDDPRFLATVEAVNKVLRRGLTVMRYLEDDGLPGREGGFHICMGWLIESLALVGRVDEARALFDEWVGLAGPLGLMSEQWEPEYGISLGNFPQAYSHLAIINAAVRLG